MVVLGMSVGSRQTGVAIIKDRELVIWQILTINPLTRTYEDALKRYVLQFNISVIIIKVPPETHITKQMDELLQLLTSLFHSFGCTIRLQTDKKLKARFPKIKNKPDVIEFTTTQYPDLIAEKGKAETSKNKYHIKMFEAVLAAHQHILTDSSHF